MNRVPQAQNVVQATKGVPVAAQKSLKGLNVLAGQKMAKGDYGAAEALAAKGKEIQRFQDEVDVLRKRWREVCGSGTSAGKKPKTPLWAYYQPILQALLQAGGSGRSRMRAGRRRKRLGGKGRGGGSDLGVHALRAGRSGI